MVKELKITAIKPDPKQPRKTFDEESLKQLSISIEKFGVLQPITVRPNGKGHIIVMGERRYRACKLANLTTIPCIVRDFDKSIVSEVQIIENLQRQDVEPIEEAEAIAYLLEIYTAEEIATRIGRTAKFVYGRIKLANLIDGFRPYVRNKELTISLAIGIAVFPKEDQEMFLEGMGDSFQSYYVNNAIKNKMFDLNDAPFSLDDDKLLPSAEACKLCPFNSANQGSLFGDDKQICTKSSCYSSKKSKSLLALIAQVKIDGRLLVANFRKYSLDMEGNQLVFSLLKENGLIPYLLDDIDYIEEPVKPTKELIKEANKWMDYSEEDLQEELDEEMVDYKEKLEEYKNAPANGYTKGLLLKPSTYRTKEVLLKMADHAVEGEERGIPLEKKKMDDCTPKEKIQKINSREDRKKHLEDNKQFEEVINSVRETEYIDTKKDLSLDEMVAFSISMHENLIGYYDGQKHFKGFYGKNNAKSKEGTVELFKKNFKKETFNKLIRILLVKNVHFGEQNHNNDLTNSSVYIALRDYCKKEMESIESTYAEIRGIREEKLKVRIAELETHSIPETK